MVVALVADLIFQSKIAGVADHLRIPTRFLRSTDELRDAALHGVTGVLLDLTIDTDETMRLIELLRRAHPALPIIGFFPHVEADLARRARAAGADPVLPRSRFVEKLAEILRGLGEARSEPDADGSGSAR